MIRRKMKFCQNIRRCTFFADNRQTLNYCKKVISQASNSAVITTKQGVEPILA